MAESAESTDAGSVTTDAVDNTKAAEAASEAKKQEHRLYFGNLAFDKTEEEVKEIFKDCGEILAINIVRDGHTTRSQGYGFISFSNAEEKAAALKLNGTEFYGRNIKVGEVRRGPREKKRLFVKNIPEDKTEDEVKELFAKYGTVEQFFFIKDHATGASRGFGFVDFSTEDEAKAALEMNGQEAFGQNLIVKIAADKTRRGWGGGYGGGWYGGYGGYGGFYGNMGGWGGYGGGWGGYAPYPTGGRVPQAPTGGGAPAKTE